MTTPPEWLSELANKVAPLFESYDVLAPLGCHYQEVDGVWEASLFCGSTEVIGGEFDGRRQDSKFFVDLIGFMNLFDQVDSLHWQSANIDAEDELGAHLSLAGIHAGNAVLFRILARAPEKFPPARKVLAYERTLEDLW